MEFWSSSVLSLSAPMLISSSTQPEPQTKAPVLGCNLVERDIASTLTYPPHVTLTSLQSPLLQTQPLALSLGRSCFFKRIICIILSYGFFPAGKLILFLPR